MCVRARVHVLSHALACRAVASANFDVWLEDLPRDLEDVFQFDFH